jgi:FtsZ-binding cell division protein ZapB
MSVQQASSSFNTSTPAAPSAAEPITPAEGTEAQQGAAGDVHSSRFASLQRKEHQIRQAQMKLAAERKKIEEETKAREEEYKTKYIPREKLSDKQSLWSTLQELGHSAQDLLELGLNPPQGVDPTISALQSEIKAIKEAQQRREQQEAERQTQEYQQAVEQLRTQTTLLIDSNGEEFEAIKSLGATEAVVKLIETLYKTEGKLLPVEEAAKQVEAKLVDRAMKMAAIGKVKAKFLPSEPVKEAKQAGASQQQSTFATVVKKQVGGQGEQQQPTQQQTIKTLTHAQNASGKLGPRERAILAFKGQLQQ